MEISARQREVLAAIVREYILTGQAVGSRTLVRRQGIESSPATVRNLMADLEDQGLLRQPHTSAGRIPTESGLRMFVNRLMERRELSGAERHEILRRYRLSDVELDGLLREVSRLLSEVSQQCAVVLVPRSECSVLKGIEFVRISERQMIVVLVMSSGLVQNRLIHVTESLSSDEMQRVHNYLNELCVGRALGDVRELVLNELESEQHRYDRLLGRALELGAQALDRPIVDDLVIEGKARLLDHTEIDPDQMKALMRGIEQKRLVLRLLDDTIHGDGVQVFIGAETKREEMRNCALVTCAYGDGKHTLGTLGVIGPSHMDYPRVVPLVDFTAGLLTKMLERG